MTFREDADIVERFVAFYRDEYCNEIEAFAQRYPDDQHSLTLDWADLDRYDPELAEKLVANPERVLDCAEEALQTERSPGNDRFGKASVLVAELGDTTSPAAFRSKHLGTLVELTGTARDTSSVRSILSEGAWECRRCGTLTHVSYTPRRGEKLPPDECAGCTGQGQFSLDHGQSTWIDRQSFVVEQRSSDGSLETTIAEVSGDATERVTPGQRVRVTGILRREPLGESNESSVPDKYVEAQTVASGVTAGGRLSSADRERIVELSNAPDIYEQMVDSIAPTVYGHRETKRALVLQLFAGVSKHLPDGSRIRGAIHTLLVGDPATSKSALGAAACRLAPDGRSLWKGRDEIHSVELEGEATDPVESGFLFVDDTGELSDESMHELAGVLSTRGVNASPTDSATTLPAQASVLCTARPTYDRFDKYEPVGDQINLDSTLLSHFDLIFTTTDTPEETADRELAEHVLHTNAAGEEEANCLDHSSPDIGQAEGSQVGGADAIEDIKPQIKPDLFRKYIAFAKKNCYPTMTEAAKETIREFYLSLRQRGSYEDAPVPITAKKIEALVRLAEASARVRLSDTVTTADTDRVINLVRSSLIDVGIDPETGEFDVDLIETGETKTQRDRRKNLKKIISEVADEHEHGAPVEKVTDRAKRIDINRSEVEQHIQTLKEEGEIYEPFADYLLVV